MVVNYGSDHISNWTCYVYNLASNSLDHVSNWKCVVLKSGHNFGQMSFFSGTLIRTDVAFGQMSLSDRSRVTVKIGRHLKQSVDWVTNLEQSLAASCHPSTEWYREAEKQLTDTLLTREIWKRSPFLQTTSSLPTTNQ